MKKRNICMLKLLTKVCLSEIRQAKVFMTITTYYQTKGAKLD